jgi:Transcriptional repressor of class III stress genes
LYDEGVVSRREADLMVVAIEKSTYSISDRQLENALRANILISLLNRLRYES